MSDEECSPRQILEKRHRTEKKDLQAKIQALKKSIPKGDKKKKKEVTENIAQLEEELLARHKEEIQQFDSNHVDQSRLEAKEKCGNEEENDEREAVDEDDIPLGPLRVKTESNRTSKAQKRRDKKAAKERERQEEIEKQEEENKHGPRAKEQEIIQQKLQQMQLKMKEIPSNGDCLFAGLVDQLNQLSIDSSVEQLRNQTATELQAQPDQYLPFLVNPSTGDMLTDEEFTDYCNKMSSTPAWGGQVELRALATILKKPIQVIQGEGPNITVGEEYKAAPLILTYHRHLHGLGEHYNSVTNVQ